MACVLVHHRNLEVLPETVWALLGEGVAPENLLVVDNSGEAVSSEDLTAAVGPRVSFTRIVNQGYGNAVNIGVEMLLSRDHQPEYILVATHEVRPEAGAIGRLVAALIADPGLAAVGPLLHSKIDDGEEWVAAGGTQTRVLGIPKHSIVAGPAERAALQPVVERTWLDGALVAYRRSAFEDRRIREDFFLYVEETEFHYRLLAEVGRVACVTGAVVQEVSNVAPPFLHARNLQWLIDLHGSRFQRHVTVPWVIGRNAVRALIGRQRWSDVKLMATGWIEARRQPIDNRLEIDPELKTRSTKAVEDEISAGG